MFTKKFALSVVRITGSIFMFAITLDMYVIVFHAMLYGNVVTVQFNAFAEAQVEYILFLLMLPFIIASIILNIRKFKYTKK